MRSKKRPLGILKHAISAKTDQEIVDQFEQEALGALIGTSLIYGSRMIYRGLLIEFEGFVMTMLLGKHKLEVDLGYLAEGMPQDTKIALEKFAKIGLEWVSDAQESEDFESKKDYN